jgi:hypothetical protein
MFQRGLRRLRRDERGQALVIGAVAMLVLAIAVLSSVSIGHGIYSKIKLQDAADAQAYSIAVKEARAYNFLAYTNRAMVVHYNAMLTFMAYVSHAFYLKTTIGNVAKVLGNVPYIGPIFKAIEQVINAWYQIVDWIAIGIVPLLSALNVALWLAQEAVVFATALDLITTQASPPIANTDKDARAGFSMSMDSAAGWSGIISTWSINLENVTNFLHPIDDAISSSQGLGSVADPLGTITRGKLLTKNKLSDPDMAKYRLLMGSIVNSSRREWTAVGMGPWILGRRWDFNLCFLAGEISMDKTADAEIKNFSENFENNRKDQLYAADSIGIELKVGCSFLSKTVFEFEFRMQVAADIEKGWHSYALKVDPPGINQTVNKKDKHHWFPGITPFFHGDPSYYKPWSYHFGYPCNFVVTTKDMIGQRKVFELKSQYMVGEGTMQKNGYLDMTWGGVGGESGDSDPTVALAQGFRDRTGGMMAVAVGRAIYHRPGDWKEEPNFFNPLWTARLAPVRTHWLWAGKALQSPEIAITNAAMGGINY